MRAEREPHYLRHRQRLRERFERSGGGGLHDYELLELLLTHAIPRRDVKPLAKELIGRLGSLGGVLDARRQELEAVRGVGPAAAGLVRLVKELFETYAAERVRERRGLSSPGAVAEFARIALAGLPYEHFMVIYLNVKNRVIGHEVVHEGTVDRAVIYPRRIIEAALARRAAGIILVHNHPSGCPEPSAEDRGITRSIAGVGRAMDIRVLDHLVVGKEGYFSFAEHDLL
ncbi:MAG: DNA repair protein RadC [bacterium]|nr:DNA repair protein RadC [bacterium]